MRTSDVARLKEASIAAFRRWAGSKIDGVFPGKPHTRVVLKRGLDNYLAREGARIDSMVNSVALLFGDEKGEVDTDAAVDLLVALFREMDVSEYRIGFVSVEVGKGKVVLDMPRHPVLDLLVGELGKVTVTAEDFLEFKGLFDK